MFPRSSKVALTFLCLVVALGLATVSEANSLVHPARDHAQLSRMIKKRVPVPEATFTPLFSQIIGAEGDSGSAGNAGAAGQGTGTGTATGTATGSGTATGTGTASATGTVAQDTSSGTSSGISNTSSSGASTSSSAGTSSATSSSSAANTSATPTPTQDSAPTFTPADDPDTQDTSSKHTSTNFVTVTDTSSQASQTAAASTTGATSTGAKITRTTIIVLVVVAAFIGGIALAWTIFRKWKLRPSHSFDDRMQPIDWQPTTPEDAGIIPNHRRAGSNASHESFHSSGHSNLGHSGSTLQPLPEHDFTAGATTLAPVGGYADLQRGPSPQPSMGELSRGPSLTRPGYDYGVPVHHQGMAGQYDYNNGVRY
ncbi:hypothetical protein FKP32DRAFT_1698303 [Trametes sanguinea]|nr:hypothetical protein FKP32DRAFT_1698303 [Trametes sanguinea]